MKLKGRRFETVSDIQRESQAVLYTVESTALRKMTSTVLLKGRKDDGIAVYIPKETILKERAVKIELLKPAFLFLT
jgi:hypothetical protein